MSGTANARIFNPSPGTVAAGGYGFGLPVLSTAQRLAATVPDLFPGMQVFDSDLSAMFCWDGTRWSGMSGNGLNLSFTSAQLAAMSAATAAQLAITNCIDCWSTSPNSSWGKGDVVVWLRRESRWVTLHDLVQPTDDFLIWTIQASRRDLGQRSCPFCTITGETPNNLATINGFTTGTGAIIDTPGSSSEAMDTHTSSVAALNSAVRACPFYRSNAAWGTSPQRALGIVMSRVSGAAAVSTAADRWQWHVGLETYNATATAAAQPDMLCLLMDDYDSLGFGVTNTNLWAVVRANSSTLPIVDTGLDATGTGFAAVVWEPTGPNPGQGRARVATATNLAATITTWIDLAVTLATTTNLQPVFAGVKNLGAGSRSVSRKWLRGVGMTTNDNQPTASVN